MSFAFHLLVANDIIEGPIIWSALSKEKANPPCIRKPFQCGNSRGVQLRSIHDYDGLEQAAKEYFSLLFEEVLSMELCRVAYLSGEIHQ